MLLLWIPTDIGEREYNEGQARRLALVDGRNARRCRRGGGTGTQRVDPHRSGDVLQRLLAEVDKGLLELVAHLTPGVLGEADAAGLGETFEPGGDVDPVAHKVTVRFLDHVAQVNSDAKLDALIGRDARIALDHAVLDRDGAAHGVDYAAKLDDDSVAGALDDPPAMRSNGGIHQIAVQLPQPRERSLLVGAHKSAVADSIGDQDRSDLPRFRHGVASGIRRWYHEWSACALAGREPQGVKRGGTQLQKNELKRLKGFGARKNCTPCR